jgi:hypothetical protein
MYFPCFPETSVISNEQAVHVTQKHVLVFTAVTVENATRHNIPGDGILQEHFVATGTRKSIESHSNTEEGGETALGQVLPKRWYLATRLHGVVICENLDSRFLTASFSVRGRWCTE